jgi:ectoine hydroxylase-related dioxygenase (phytanoyl-CoA dioxygenase family)
MPLAYETALDHLRRHGYCRIRGVLSESEVGDLRAAAFEVAAAAPQASFGATGALHHLGIAYEHPRFTDLATDTRALGLLARALTPNLHIYHSHLDIHPPEPPSDAWRWHEDGGRMSADLDMRALLSVKVSYFLSDVEADGLGNLMVIPGSHRWTEPLARTPGCEPEGATPVLAHAGDAVVLDRRVWHGRSTNVSQRTRMVVFFGYAPRWIAQREIPPAELLQQEVVPLRRQILGAPDWDPCHVARDDLPVSAVVDNAGTKALA